jgi:hypothetical protein
MPSDLRSHFSLSPPIVAFLAFVSCALAACGPGGSEISSHQAATPPPVSWLDGFMLGTKDDPFRGITQDTPRFEQGEQVQLQLNATNAAANASVRVEWIDPRGKTVGTQEQFPAADETKLTFVAPREITQAKGQYQVRVDLEGRRMHEGTFEVIEPASSMEDPHRSAGGP